MCKNPSSTAKWRICITEKEFDKLPYDELEEELKFFRPGGQIMYDAFGVLNPLFKPFCKRDKKHKKDPYFEEELVAMHIKDLFNPYDLINASRVIGRTPLATFCIYADYMWRMAKQGRRSVLKRAVKSAIRNGFVVKEI